MAAYRPAARPPRNRPARGQPAAAPPTRPCRPPRRHPPPCRPTARPPHKRPARSRSARGPATAAVMSAAAPPSALSAGCSAASRPACLRATIPLPCRRRGFVGRHSALLRLASCAHQLETSTPQEARAACLRRVGADHRLRCPCAARRAPGPGCAAPAPAPPPAPAASRNHTSHRHCDLLSHGHALQHSVCYGVQQDSRPRWIANPAVKQWSSAIVCHPAECSWVTGAAGILTPSPLSQG